MKQRLVDGAWSEEAGCVPFDAIAYLSGVNYGSVVKVFAAIEAFSRGTGTPIASVVRFEDTPTSPVIVDEPACKQRMKASARVVRDLVRGGYTDDYESVLRASARFDL